MTDLHADEVTTGTTRRQLLRRGALVAGVAAWTVPVVQMVSMTPAHADTTSGVSGGGGGQPGHPVNPPHGGGGHH